MADVLLRCGSCGDPVVRSSQRARTLRRDGLEPVCWSCRYPSAPRVVTEAHRAYWRERFSADELVVLAGALEP